MSEQNGEEKKLSPAEQAKQVLARKKAAQAEKQGKNGFQSGGNQSAKSQNSNKPTIMHRRSGG